MPEPDKQPAGGGCSQAIEPARYVADRPMFRFVGPAREPETPFGVGLGAALGWRVLRVHRAMIESGEALALVRRAIETARGERVA